MYFDLPTAHERNSESPDSNNKNKKPIVADERLIEIINNIQDHWGSPPIMTPETLAYVLNNQWVKDHQLMPLDSPRLTVLNTRANHPQENEKERDGLASEPTASSVLNLVTELCRTMRHINSSDGSAMNDILMKDPHIQSMVQHQKLDNELSPQQVLSHVTQLLSKHNDLAEESKSTV
ncbi:hypothetical protein J3Q64DRAFT_1733668 [Phycomyces blakesleeanus]|uniref:Uncharacterized protein n=2 Tax=Phycomyces blakesleeanus TaxID=4837 RepID=A0A162TTA3_PHYB8|nr:hypothetical protein PHYBLDRAFT_78310 [Phycomyces blakesleeanus NRRL 1555(-)]OAD69623.1 hypothetical protein PHYBLDRAFT_78310 [Phycomyces blakesleeanus NRRL 1555(-)]|eukprot:XP_018287663.1 hypothetical protein PHYBLDRAFT_78310 [Phycomyces blakesleeanus NRRL 1555(-)]